jgi:hypothetical protein
VRGSPLRPVVTAGGAILAGPGVNKDDVQVGVRAIDREGNRSPVAVTTPLT